MEEFSIEAHKEFASQLLLYRQAVVMSVITPSIDIMANADVELWFDLVQSLATQGPSTKHIKATATDASEALTNEIQALASEDVDVPKAKKSPKQTESHF